MHSFTRTHTRAHTNETHANTAKFLLASHLHVRERYGGSNVLIPVVRVRYFLLPFCCPALFNFGQMIDASIAWLQISGNMTQMGDLTLRKPLRLAERLLAAFYKHKCTSQLTGNRK